MKSGVQELQSRKDVLTLEYEKWNEKLSNCFQGNAGSICVIPLAGGLRLKTEGIE